MAKRKPPKPPAQIAAEKVAQRAKDFEAVNLQPEAAALVSSADIEVRRGGRKNAEGARRLDAFGALKDGLSEAQTYDAVRRLERDLIVSRGEHDRGKAVERVDNDKAGDRTDAMIEASERVRDVLSRVGDRDAWLLTELISPSVSTMLAATTWRDIVRHITGETHEHAQGAVVRSACANLTEAYRQPDKARSIQVWRAPSAA